MVALLLQDWLKCFTAPFLSFVRVSHGMNCSHYYYMKPWVLLMQYIANEEIQMLIKRKIS